MASYPLKSNVSTSDNCNERRWHAALFGACSRTSARGYRDGARRRVVRGRTAHGAPAARDSARRRVVSERGKAQGAGW
eukprot:6181578-Pleurochrysis_carterae.AAC.1